MATPSINGVNVIDSMKSRGVYVFNTQMTGATNGQGAAVLAGPQSVSWTFSSLTPTEWTWLTTTILGGSASVAITAAELWDHTKTAQTFTSGNLYLPQSPTYRGGMYWGVTVTISHLLPLILS